MEPRYALREKITIEVPRRESGFDRACDFAYEMALDRFGCDEDGYINNVIGAGRDHTLFVEFVNYVHSGNMVGHSHIYTFKAHVGGGEEELENE